MNVYDFKTGRLVDPDAADAPQDEAEPVAVAHANDPGARAFMQGAVRSLRRRGIPAVARCDESEVLPRWIVVVLARDEDRARVAFDAYMERVNARSAKRRR